MKSNKRDGGTCLVEWLKQAGVEHVFSVSGGPLNPIYSACAALDLPLVHTRHEAAACFMAEASARVTGKAAVAAVTLGPGVTNTVTPALVSTMAGTPLLIVAAQAPTSTFERGAGMSWDPLPILDSVTKWSARVLDVDRIPEYLDIAWRKMWSDRPGPVLLEVPIDVLSAETKRSADSVRPLPQCRPRLTAADASAISDVMSDARRPIFILGDELFWDRSDRLETALERHGAPFTTLRLARGIVDETHALWAGPAYAPCNATLRRALSETDCVFLLGHHFEFDLAFGDGVSPDAEIVQLLSDAGSLHRNRHASHAVLATPSSAVSAIAEADPMSIEADWSGTIVDGWNKERAAQLGEPANGALHPVAAIDAVFNAAPEETIFVSSHGNVDFWADARLRLRTPGRYLRAGQSGALGAELPYGVGARFADPGAPVIVFVGDGGVGYHVTELDTAARYGRPVVVVVLDDELWGAIALPQEMAYGRTYEMDLPRRDWVRVAEGLGGGGRLTRNVEELGEAVREAVSSDVPQIIQVPVASVISPYMEFIS